MASHGANQSVFAHSRLREVRWHLIPVSARCEAADYVIFGTVMHPFMRAIAAHRMLDAVRFQRKEDIRNCLEFFRDLPVQCHGSLARVAEWEMLGGFEGIVHITENMRALWWI